MEEIYMNVDPVKRVKPKPSSKRTGLSRCYHAVIICLGLFCVFLLIGLIILGVHFAELSAIKYNLTELLQVSGDKLSSMTEEVDQLNFNLTANMEKVDRLQTLLKQSGDKLSSIIEERDRLKTDLTAKMEEPSKPKKKCPSGWTVFGCSCYFNSSESGSWDRGREDCRGRGADLVVIDSPEEQEFLSSFTTEKSWIGLNDRDEEGAWKWVDGTPLTLKFWAQSQPDNGAGQWGEEDCVHVRTSIYTSWNDLACTYPMKWVCEL